ncbi:GNAT family N-acetyltransferase [Xenorhabdus vietnamensis]|uniref:GNAT family N-acetyltransferase n=1 Tax=Xenorhabdus vietnamensis TaxID=351656 RepID=A0A1Y2SCN9_9GAMM|nr:N-acetyltransferase [Xenorhabdus vietnamensis]OTA15729.1 GNAT family N-acetyltransferase [Xenorhabdus vietnamensis]
MIRIFTEADMDAVLSIWLEASIKAHNFVAAEFWQSQVNNMKHIYIPSSELYVYVQDSKVAGFYALHENNLAAVFVSPDKQGQGIGKALLSDAKNRRTELTLSVYQQNQASCEFYLSQGFYVANEEIDENTGCKEYVMRLKR